ncbi:MAG TPA: CHC2 zinc finger domain-containing protein [Candidatus Acidoferrales bacterium]|nr:CHC2 zinc finger domain-containing protein [Candidatus Acidoferrales bacterium]
MKRRCDFLAIAGRYMRLRRAGRQWRALCPFHSERNPSLYIEPEKKLFKCFGCGRAGDLYDFIMLAERCDFSTALKIVSDFVGVGRAARGEAASAVRASEGAKPLSGPKARVTHSPDSRASILAALDATEARNAAIRTTNDSASAEFATACEPSRGAAALLFINKRITGPEK